MGSTGPSCTEQAPDAISMQLTRIRMVPSEVWSSAHVLPSGGHELLRTLCHRPSCCEGPTELSRGDGLTAARKQAFRSTLSMSLNAPAGTIFVQLPVESPLSSPSWRSPTRLKGITCSVSSQSCSVSSRNVCACFNNPSLFTWFTLFTQFTALREQKVLRNAVAV